MTRITTVYMQYVQFVYGEANVDIDVDKVERDYGVEIRALTQEQWGEVASDAERFAPKGYDGLVDYTSSYVNSEKLSDFAPSDIYDSTAPDTVAEARGEA